MFSKFSLFVKNLKIKYKILLCMITITTIALLLIGILSYNYFASVYEHDTKANAQYTLDNTSISFRNHMDLILRNTAAFVSSTPVFNTFQDISFNNKEKYIYNYINIQDYLEKLIQSENLIDTIIITGKNNEFFALTKYGINHDASNHFGWNLDQVDGISLLPICKSPLPYSGDVLPIIIPIHKPNFTNDSYMVSGTVNDSIGVIYILLDANKVNDYFRESNKNPNSTLYLANQNGQPISLFQNSEIYSIATNSDVINHINAAAASSEFSKSVGNDTYLIASKDAGICDLKIVSVVSKKELFSGIKTIKSIILGEWVLSFCLTVILSLMLSQFITRPIVSLMEVVKRIKDGTYNTKKFSKYNDEIGILYKSINSMYDTIQLQIDLIKQEEQDKAKSEIKILTEQINPHFIYNTLECIHLEILSENTEASAAMIESLGEFLRVALNYGNSMIPIEQELKHTTEYINIMNLRSNQRIAFSYKLDDCLKYHKIVKLILQPLAENSFKHGFANDIKSGIILSPYIEININLKENNRIFIEVSDNGRGIDIDKANTALYQISTDDKSHHVGLHNVYKRLRLYYDNSVNINFYTTPYYRNSVIIDIPYIEADN